jgi:hypothetical protein
LPHGTPKTEGSVHRWLHGSTLSIDDRSRSQTLISATAIPVKKKWSDDGLENYRREIYLNAMNFEKFFSFL